MTSFPRVDPAAPCTTGDPEAPAFDGSQPCAQIDPALFFPEKGGSSRFVKRICASCRFREPCLEYALTATVLGDRRVDGIWGGTSVVERERLRRGEPIDPLPPPLPIVPIRVSVGLARRGKPACTLAGAEAAEWAALRSGRLKRPILHGTRAGYMAHRRHDVPFPPGDPCGCRAAANRYAAEAQRRRYWEQKAISQAVSRPRGRPRKAAS